ncbi:MAG: putative PROLIN-rich signal peptide protein [Paucimonas sp.]|nr:putative PROLIN-rich signal peptide protein [Paucimonas sp.]
MSKERHPRPAQRWGIGTLAVLVLSVLLHVFLLQALVKGGDGNGDGKQASGSGKRETVVVQLSAAAPAASPAEPAPAPPVRKPTRKPRPPAAAKPARTEPLPPAQPEPAAAATLQAVEQEAAPDAMSEQDKPEPQAGNTEATPLAGMPADQLPGEGMANPTAPKTWLADPPPPAELRYTVQAIRAGQPYHGRGKIRFTREADAYAVEGEAKLLFFSVLEFRSNGSLDQHGLAPVLYSEKRFRRSATNTHFQRERQLISFSASTTTYPRQGGEQDRASIVWQLAAIGRADRQQLATGSELSLFVAGVRDGESWLFRVAGEEQVEVDGKPVQAVHIVRLPRPGSWEQRLDIWLAPAMQWYPVKLRFTETSGDYLDMSLDELPLALPRL